MYQISVVNFLNSLPFVYGLNNYKFKKKPKLIFDVPSECARKIINNETDIGLIPVAAIPSIKNGQIISNFCISAESDVKTVVLASNKKFSEIETIEEDSDSLTSVNMVKILEKNYWKKNFSFKKQGEAKCDAKILIGDKAFNAENKFTEIIDIAEQWIDKTGLPAVFACWVSNKKIENSFIEELNSAFELGINNIEKIKGPNPNGYSLQKYLNKNLKYYLSEEKNKSIDLYLNLLKEL